MGTTNRKMSEADVEVRLANVRDYADQIGDARKSYADSVAPLREVRAEADDKSTMDRAADLLALFQSKHWVATPTPAQKRGPGRPKDHESKEQFTAYIKRETKLSPSWTKRLLSAAQFVERFRDQVPGTLPLDSERLLRPLVEVDATPEEMRAVFDWTDAYADGNPITVEHTQKAVKHLKEGKAWQARHPKAQPAIKLRDRINAQADDLSKVEDGGRDALVAIRKHIDTLLGAS